MIPVLYCPTPAAKRAAIEVLVPGGLTWGYPTVARTLEVAERDGYLDDPSLSYTYLQWAYRGRWRFAMDNEIDLSRHTRVNSARHMLAYVRAHRELGLP